MKILKGISLKDVQEEYSGAGGRLWELVMGEQIHIGGLQSSMNLAKTAGISKGMEGADFCSCSGAGMRFLVRFFGVKKMIGVDATAAMVELGKKRNLEEGLSDKISFVLSGVCESGLPSESLDFIWGEDAWCYVEDKPKMISEAARIVKKGGLIAFTDWLEGKENFPDNEAERFLKFMKFPNILNLKEYIELLKQNNFEIIKAEYTDLFPSYIQLYIDMLSKQLTYDALKIIGFNSDIMNFLAGEMNFILDISKKNKIAQAIFVAKKK